MIGPDAEIPRIPATASRNVTSIDYRSESGGLNSHISYQHGICKIRLIIYSEKRIYTGKLAIIFRFPAIDSAEVGSEERSGQVMPYGEYGSG